MSTEKRERQRANRQSARVELARVQQNVKRQRLVVFIGVAVLVVLLVIAFMALGGDETNTADFDYSAEAAEDDGDRDSAPSDGDDALDGAVGTGDCPAEDGSSPRTIDFDGPQPMCIDPGQTHVAVFDTSEGVVRVALDTENTPLTTNNFVTLARWGYYDGTTIFRTDPSIEIIQGGSPHTESASDPGPGYNIVDEPSFELDPATGRVVGPYSYVPGQLVMARAAGFDSAGAQFFFTTGPNAAFLDGQGSYVVFGATDEGGLGVLRQIIGLHEAGGPLGGAPSRTVTINSVTIEVS